MQRGVDRHQEGEHVAFVFLAHQFGGQGDLDFRGLGLGGNESYPDLFQPYGGFPDGVRVENGHITMPDLPGIGFEGKSDLYAEMKALAE